MPLLLALAMACLCMPRAAWAQSVSCANPTVSNIQFGTVDFMTGVVNISGSIGWSCTSSGILGLLLSPQANIVMCLNLSTGSGGSQANPRLLGNGNGGTLSYQLFTNAANTLIWGATTTPATPTPLGISVSIPAGLLFSTTVTGQTTFYAQLQGGQPTTAIGTYTSSLAVTVNGAYTMNTGNAPASCTGGPYTLNAGSASFVASAIVQKACVVTASSANLGTVASTAVNTTTSGTINVTCTNGTNYFVGLKPSNGSTTGAGIMHASLGTNVDKVPYQLSSTAGPTGVPWGNTATSTTTGNGVAGTGSGLQQALPVHATAASANFTPDTYTDTVTVNVNY